MEKMMVKLGAPQDAIDKSLVDLNDPKNFTIGKVFLGFCFAAIGWFIVSLIIAAIIKKKRPEFENQI
jgi:predicted membrane-bound spermidine synthase